MPIDPEDQTIDLEPTPLLAGEHPTVCGADADDNPANHVLGEPQSSRRCSPDKRELFKNDFPAIH